MRNPLTRDTLLSLFSAPLIWTAHFVLCYGLVSLACAYGFPGARIGVGLLTVIALALLGAVAWFNLAKWRAVRHSKAPDAGMQAFFALNSLMLCGLSAVALVWVALPAALLPTCAA